MADIPFFSAGPGAPMFPSTLDAMQKSVNDSNQFDPIINAAGVPPSIGLTGAPMPAAPIFPQSAINWRRDRVGLGGVPIPEDHTVIDVPTDALRAAQKATDPKSYVAEPKKSVRDYIASGKPMALAEVNAFYPYTGSDVGAQLRYSNGRNRIAAAHELGEPTVPVVVPRDNIDQFMALLAKYDRR
jgi:hypothetical protein